MQGFPVQLGTSGDEVVQQLKGRFRRFVQAANPSLWLLLRYKQQSSLAFVSVLLLLSMRDGETLKAYSGTYWEMYNEMDDNFDNVAINTFKNSLPAEHGLRKSLTGKPATSVCQLMDQIDKYKRVEEDQL